MKFSLILWKKVELRVLRPCSPITPQELRTKGVLAWANSSDICEAFKCKAHPIWRGVILISNFNLGPCAVTIKQFVMRTAVFLRETLSTLDS